MESQESYLTQQTQESSRKPTLLVIEQNQPIEQLLLHTFTFYGYQCSAVDAEHIASLTWIESSAQMLPHGVVLDIDIEATNFQSSFDFLRAFCARWCTVTGRSLPPLLLLTTQPTARDVLQQEGYRVVMKPFLPKSLPHIMKAEIERKQERRSIEIELAYR